MCYPDISRGHTPTYGVYAWATPHGAPAFVEENLTLEAARNRFENLRGDTSNGFVNLHLTKEVHPDLTLRIVDRARR